MTMSESTIASSTILTMMRLMRPGINMTADTAIYTKGVSEADKKLKEFVKNLNLPKPVKKPKSTKPVDFNKFLRQLCKRRK